MRLLIVKTLEILQFSQALSADLLAFELDDIGRVVAEDAGGLILAENDIVAVYEDLYGIALGQVKGIPQFLGDNDSSKLI
jgi:hypothetical protein